MTNILLVLSDQHRADYLGYREAVPVSTPCIDALARRGVSWDRALTPAPICGPARAALFTGRHPHQVRGCLLPDGLGVRTEDDAPTGVERDMMINDSRILEEPDLTRRLKQAGYHTAYAGKWHLGNDVLGEWFDEHSGEDNAQYVRWLEEQGLPIDGWPLKDPEVRSRREPHMSIPHTKVNPLDAGQCNDPWITDLALDMIRRRPGDQPFFQVVGLNGPHPPFKVPEPYYSMYNPADFDEPRNFRPGDGEPDSRKASFYRRLWEDQGESWEDWRQSAAVYAGFCTQIDRQLGRLVDALEDEGVLDDTLVIYTSDHGEMLGQHGLWHKMQPYEMSLRVPLVMAGPGVDNAGIVDKTAALTDIPSTILHAAGLDGNDFGTGRDLRKTDSPAPDFWFAEQEPLGGFHGETDWRLAVDERWKFVWNRGDSPELYDLESDPDELENLAGGRYPEVEERLIPALLEWMERTGDPLLGAASEELRG